MASLKVFGLPASTDVSRVLTCLFEKEVEFQLIRTDTYKNDHKVPEFLRLQDPSGQVIVKHGKHTFNDSRKICRHICEKFPNSGNRYLYGTGGLERASIEQWLLSESRNFEPSSSALVFHLAFAEHLGLKPDEQQIELHENRLARILDVYNSRLEESKYLAGDEFTLADLSHLPNSHYLTDRSKRGRKLFYDRPYVAEWWEDISSRESWKKVVYMQSEHPGPLEKFSFLK